MAIKTRLRLFLTMFILLALYTTAYEIVGNTVIYDSQYANMTVSPHTVINPEFNYQYFTVQSKALAGDLCIAYVFNEPLQDGSLEYYTGNSYLNINVNHYTYGGYEIYMPSTYLYFDTYSNHTWRIQYKPGNNEGKWNLWAWNTPNENCISDFQSADYNFFYDLDPWYSTKDQNLTQGFVYLTNNTYSDTFEFYNVNYTLANRGYEIQNGLWEIGLNENGFGFNSNWLNTTSSGGVYTTINKTFIDYNNFETILKIKRNADTGSERIDIKFDGFTGISSNYRIWANSARMDFIIDTKSVTSGSLNDDEILYIKFRYENGFCEWLTSSDFGDTFTLKLNQSCIKDDDITLIMSCRDANCYFDQLLIRELMPDIVSQGDYKVSFIYDSANATTMNRAVIRYYNNDNLIYSPSRNVAEGDNVTDAELNSIYKTLTSGHWQGFARVYDQYGNGAYNFSTNYLSIDVGNLNISIYDEAGDLINDSIKVEVSNNNYFYEQETSIGHIDFALIPIGDYDVTLSGDNYITRLYSSTVVLNSDTILNTYLVNSSSYVVFTIKDDDTGTAIQGATLTVYKIIDGISQTIGVYSSDITGGIKFSYNPTTGYRFVLVKSGYESRTFELNPIIFTEYTVNMERTTTALTDSIYSGVSIYYYPKLFYEGTNTLTFSIAQPEGLLDNYYINVSYLGTYEEYIGTSNHGEVYIMPFNITGATHNDRINITIYYKIINGSEYSFTNQYFIIANPSNSTWIQTLKAEKYGMALLERIILVTFIVLLLAGTAAFYTGPTAGGVIGIFIFGFFAYAGFLPGWFVVIPVVAGFFLLMGGRYS